MRIACISVTDYHSVDGGDVLTGRPYGYTEEYQSYEQTGTEQYVINSRPVSYWSAYGTGCSQRYSTPNGVGCTWKLGNPNGATCDTSGCTFTARTDYTYGTRPVYGYVTRTRTVTYDKQSGLFQQVMLLC